jgi:glutathione-independent formaldehyde dehydrogenase
VVRIWPGRESWTSTSARSSRRACAWGSGHANVKAYNRQFRQLRDLIAASKANSSFVVSQGLPLDDAIDAYERFDDREDGWTKIVLHP